MIVLGNFAPPSLVPDSLKVWSRCDSQTPQNPYLLQFIPYMGKKTPELAHMAFISMLLIHSKNQSGVQILGCTHTMPIHL